MSIFTIEPDEDKKSYYKNEEINWKKLGIIFAFAIIGLIVTAILELKLPPAFTYKGDYYLDKKVHVFKNITIREGRHRVGFYTAKISPFKKPNDGDYSLEYYCDNKLVRKVKNFKRHRKSRVAVDSDNGKNMIFIDEFFSPKDISCKKVDLKLYTNKEFSLFKTLKINGPVVFYVRRFSKKTERMIEKGLSSVGPSQETLLKKFYPKNFNKVEIESYDGNEIKSKVLKALFDKNLEEYKRLVKEHNLDIDFEMGQDKHWKDTKRTALFYAAYLNDLKTVKYLIKNNANIYHRDFVNKSVLQYAIENNAVDVVRYLFTQGLNKKDACYLDFSYFTKVTPLHYTIKKQHFELFKVLLENGFREVQLNCKEVPKLGEYVDSSGNLTQVYKSNTFSPPETTVHIYRYLYRMEDPVPYLRLYKKYDLRDLEYENRYSKEWLIEHYKKCKTGNYRGRCVFINKENIKAEEYDIFKFFELVGKDNIERNKKKRGNK